MVVVVAGDEMRLSI